MKSEKRSTPTKKALTPPNRLLIKLFGLLTAKRLSSLAAKLALKRFRLKLMAVLVSISTPITTYKIAKLIIIIIQFTVMISLTSCGKKEREIIYRQLDPHYHEEMEQIKKERQRLKQAIEEAENIKGKDGRDGEKGDKGDTGEPGPQGERGEQGIKGERGRSWNDPQPTPTPPLKDR